MWYITTLLEATKVCSVVTKRDGLPVVKSQSMQASVYVRQRDKFQISLISCIISFKKYM